MEPTTWDGLPVSAEQPFGASVVVWRRNGDTRGWLLLHRHHHGPDDEGAWAWTPPSGARFPGETVDDCARRELREETGLTLDCVTTELGGADWLIYAAEAPAGAEIVLDDEHDRFAWLSLENAVARCLPAAVGESIAAVAAYLDQRAK